MDSPWRSELYVPSSACETAPYELLDNKQLDDEISNLSDYTKEIRNLPYDPEPWLNRSQCLRVLGYPDLALGDIYKARLLVEAALENHSVLGKYTHPSGRKTVLELINGALEGRSKLGEKAILTFGLKMYFQHVTDPSYSKWISTVATPTLLEKRAVGMLKRLEIQIWSELMDGLLATNACQDYLDLSLEAVTKFDNDPVFVSEYQNAEAWSEQRQEILQGQVDNGEMSPTTMDMTIGNGGFYPVPYPWMTEDLLSRDDDLLATLQNEFKQASENSTVKRSTIRDSHFEDGIEMETTIDVLGVFATRDIEVGETTLLDETIACVVSASDRCPTCCGPMPLASPRNPPITNSCCKKAYCSTNCAEIALEEFHGPECGLDEVLQEYYAEACTSTDSTDFQLEHLLFIRLIGKIQTEKAHPLKSSYVQRFTPAYSTENLTIFNWKHHISKPTDILLAMGVDVFKDLEWDTWVLQTMRCRLQNNKHGVIYAAPGGSEYRIVGSSISPLYSMMNHSCAPNVTWEFLAGEAFDGESDVDGRCSTVRMFANRRIRKGEELSITYILPLDISRRERNARLISWLGGECRCGRCMEDKKKEGEE